MNSYKKLLSFIFTFIPACVLARWSAIEHIHKQDIKLIYGSISKGKVICVDLNNNKHTSFTTYDTMRGTPYAWRYGYKPGTVLFGGWQDTILYIHTNQMEPPPYSHSSIAVDNQGRIHMAFSYIDEATNEGRVYYTRRSPTGVWGPLEAISGVINRPGDIAIATNSTGVRKIITYTCFVEGVRYVKAYISDGVATATMDIDVAVDDEYSYCAVDEAGYFYVVYLKGGIRCVQISATAPFTEKWNYLLGGSFCQVTSDHITGKIHFALIRNDSLIYLYRNNGDTISGNWFGLTTLLRNTTNRFACISVHDSIIGIISGPRPFRDTLYFRKTTTWDTITLPNYDGTVYTGRSIFIDPWGYTHIVGNTRIIGPSALPYDSIYYFTDRIKPRIIIIPDTIAIPDAGGTTNPGVPITYMHRVINAGNTFDTFGLFIEKTKIDSVAALIYKNDTIRYPDTLYIKGTTPGDTDTVYLLIIPSDTCKPCFKDSTEFIGYSFADPTVRDSALDTTRVMIDVIIEKRAISPPTTDSVYPKDTITYKITFRDTWCVRIDSITIYDPLDPTFDTIWVVSSTAIDDTYFIRRDTLIWTIRNQHPPQCSSILIIRGVVKEFDCDDSIPQTIKNFAYTPGAKCILPYTSNTISHNIAPHLTRLRLTKTAIPSYDTLVPGDTVSFHLTCQNIGRFPAKKVIIEDFLDDDIYRIIYANRPTDTTMTPNSIRWNVDCILPDSSYYCTFRIIVSYEYKGIDLRRYDTLYNYARATGDPNWVADTAHSNRTIHYIFRKVQVHLDKISNPPTRTIVLRGDSIFYKIICKSDTSNSIIRNITIVDTVDDDLVAARHITPTPASYIHPEIRWQIDSLAPGDSFVATFYGIIPTDAPLGDSIVNYYRFIYPDFNINAPAQDTTVHYIATPILEINKDAYMPFPDRSSVLPGDNIHYYIIYKNTGTDIARNVILIDLIDTTLIDTAINITSPPTYRYTGDSIIWNLGNLVPGFVDTLEYLGIVKWTAPMGDTIINKVISYGIIIDTIKDSTMHFIRTGNKINKWAIPPSGRIVRLEDTITFYLSYKTGTIDTNVIIIDTVDRKLDPPFDISDGGVWNPANRTIRWVLNIPQNSVDTVSWKAIVTNEAANIGDTIYNYGWFITRIENVKVGPTIHPIGMPNLRFKKIASPISGSYVTAGDIITYTLRCDNSLGTDTARRIIVYDTLSEYFTSPDIIIWNVRNIPPGEIRDTTFSRTIRTNLTQTDWGDTVFNIPVLIPRDPDVDTIKDTTIHILEKVESNEIMIIKGTRRLDGSLLSESTVVWPGDTFLYYISIKNNSQVKAKNAIITDTIKNIRDMVFIDSVIYGPDSVWRSRNNINWFIDSIMPDQSISCTFRVRIEKEIEIMNIRQDTIDTIINNCWIYGMNVDTTKSNTHILYLGAKYGVEIKPDTIIADSIFLGERKICTLKVKNLGIFKDDVSIEVINSNPQWSISLNTYYLSEIKPDSIKQVRAVIKAPDVVSTNVGMIIATSKISERRGKVVKDTTFIICSSRRRVVNIIVDPDTVGEVEEGKYIQYILRVINNGNDYDVIDLNVISKNGWRYKLTHTDTTEITDADGDNKPDVGVIPPYGGKKELLLRVWAPEDVTIGINTPLVDTIIVWGTSSINTNIKDSAKVITKVIIPESDIHNYPNPFHKNKGTTFVFKLKERTECNLIIYTRKGEVVKVVIPKGTIYDKGRHEITWDATNEMNKKVAPGTYIYVFKADKTIKKKLVVLPAEK